MSNLPLNRRSFLSGLGLFTILPSAGRIWKALRSEPETFLVSAVDLCSDYERYCAFEWKPTHGWFCTVTGSRWAITEFRALSPDESLRYAEQRKSIPIGRPV